MPDCRGVGKFRIYTVCEKKSLGGMDLSGITIEITNRGIFLIYLKF